MTDNNITKKLILVVSEQGDVGKSYISSGIADQIRNKLKKECSIYLLDGVKRAGQTFDRLCARDDNGDILEVQTAKNGVEVIDIHNNGKEETGKENNKEAVKKFKACLADNSEYVLLDFPNASVSFIQELFKKEEEVNGEILEGELGLLIKQLKKEVYVVVPFKDDKSLSSLKDAGKLFHFERGVYGNVADKVNLIGIYNDIGVNEQWSYNDLEENPIVCNSREKWLDKFKLLRLLEVDKAFLDHPEIRKYPFSHFYDEETGDPINLPEGVDKVDFGLFIRRVVRGGFMPIAKQLFREE